ADVTVPSSNGARSGLIARYSGPGDNNYYLGMVYNNNGVYEAHIYLKNGNFTLLADQPIPGFSGSGHLEFMVICKQLALFVDGTLRASAYDSTITGAGLVGVRGFAGTFDNFDVVNQPPLTAPPTFTDSFASPQNGVPLSRVWSPQTGVFTIQNNAA